MSAWSHLPNVAHIDRVLATLTEHPEIWAEARDAARDVAWCEAYDAAWNAAYNAAYDAGRIEDYDVASSVILSLIAYDDCEQYLSMTSEELRVWSLLSNNPAAILLLPAVIAFERIKKLETV
jgi:hypothetical protein